MTHSRRTLLLVDDDADLLRLLTLRLQAEGYAVQTASSAEQAMARIAVARPRVVLTDLRMGGMDGLALFEQLQKQDPTLPVILMTAHGTIPDAVDATQRGVFGYLTKPFKDSALLDLLERAMLASGGDEAAQLNAHTESWRADLITGSSVMESLLAEAHLVALRDVSVLIQGASGTGKEVLARAIHKASPRSAKPFVTINCAAIPEQLLESELFGHTKGAFTGAVSAHKGLFQSAEGGTLFLDEIGDMPVALQAKLLRVLQEKEVRPLGANQVVPVDVRIISATHRSLEDAIAEGAFREDLYYRLNVVRLNLPSLRQRREDIPLLARYFLRLLNQKQAHQVNDFTPEALEKLIRYDWPGNIRQLLNVVEQCCVLCTSDLAPLALVSRALQDLHEKPGGILPYAEAKQHFDREYLIQLLKITNGQVSEAARMAGRNRTEFYRLLHRYHLSPDMFKPDTE
jgi:two-component system response regulator GlrR